MDIDKIINIIREQNLKVGRKLPADLPGMGGGGGGTNALTSQAKVRSIRQMITDPNGSKLRRQQHNDPQNYLTDKEFKNRGEFPGNKKRKPYKEEMSMGPTNNVGDGKIAGTVQAGDDPPVRRKKKYIYQKGLRKNWMV